MPETPQELDLHLEGIALHAATWGERPAPRGAVLLVHGLTANSRSMAAIGEALAAADWFAIAPDLRGRGKSGKPAHGYGVPFHADDLLGLCDTLDLARVHVVGHSLGAYIAMYLAALAPDRIDRLVLIDGGGQIPPDVQQMIAASLSRLGAAYSSVDAYIEAMRRTMLPIFGQWDDFWETYYRYDAEPRPGGTVASSVPRATIEEELRANAVTLNVDLLASAVRVPTLILRAERGILGPDQGVLFPAPEAARLQAAIPGSRLVEIAGANHYTIGPADATAREIGGFLAKE